jgi:hypothetical protein
MFNELGDKYGIASSLQHIGYLALMEGDDAQAQNLIEQGLTIARGAGPKWLSVVCLARLAGLVAVRGQTVDAVRLWAAAEALMAARASYMDSADRIYYERTIAPACVAVSEEALERARAEGRAMPLEEAIPYALRLVRSEF